MRVPQRRAGGARSGAGRYSRGRRTGASAAVAVAGDRRPPAACRARAGV